MSPKPPDPSVRSALIEQAARILTVEGDTALTTRRLAASAGVSTMAIYTYFGGMDDVRRAVRLEAFDRLARALARVPRTDDALADAAALGAAYFANARDNPDLYRVMCFEEVSSEEERERAFATFGRLADAAQRAVEAGEIDGDGAEIARQLWAFTHGVASLVLARMWDEPEALGHFAAGGRAMLIGRGARPDRVDTAIAYAARFLVAGVNDGIHPG